MDLSGWWPLDRASRRRALDELAGAHPLRRVAVWIERFAGALAVVGLVLPAVLAGTVTELMTQESGRNDPQVRAITTAAAVGSPGPTTGYTRADAGIRETTWSAPVAWTDPQGVRHVGRLGVSGDVPAGTAVAGRLASDGTVRGAPENIVNFTLDVTGAGVAIVGAYLLLVIGAAHLLRPLLDRLRRDSWDSALVASAASGARHPGGST